MIVITAARRVSARHRHISWPRTLGPRALALFYVTYFQVYGPFGRRQQDSAKSSTLMLPRDDAFIAILALCHFYASIAPDAF